jgi:hypothetical protein
MKEELKAILGNLSYDDIQEALVSKKKSQIDALRKKRQEIRKELNKITAQFERKLSAVDVELEQLTGKAAKTVKKASGAVKSGELTSAIMKIFGSAPGRTFDASKIVSQLKDAGFSGDIDIAKNKMAIYLSRLLQRGYIKRISRGLYTVNSNKQSE